MILTVMPFPLGNFMWALVKDKKKMCTTVTSLNKIILWEKKTASVEPVISLYTPN